MNTATQPIGLPPKPLNAPAWLQQLQWVGNPVGYMETAARQHPDIFAASVVGFGDRLVFVNQPQAIQDILTNDRKTFLALGSTNRILSPILGDSSVIMLDRQQHKRRRQLLMPPFHGERMRTYGQLICNLTTAAFDALPLDRPFSARTSLQAVSLNVIMQAVFGLSEGDRLERLKQLLVSLLELFRSPLSSSFLFFSVLQKTWVSGVPGVSLCVNVSKLMR